MISRTHYSVQERDTRSRAAQLLANPFFAVRWYYATAPAASPTVAVNAAKNIRRLSLHALG